MQAQDNLFIPSPLGGRECIISMKAIYWLLIILFFATTLVLAQDSTSSSDIIAKMESELDLQPEQVFNITPIIEKYTMEFQDLQKSIKDGTMNPSAVDSQRQGIEAAETQDLSQYLKPNQLSEWRSMQAQTEPQKGDENADADQYSNLPRNAPSQ